MTKDKETNRFAGASRYVLDEELAKIVNISMALEMPLLLKGEPGTGNTEAKIGRSMKNLENTAQSSFICRPSPRPGRRHAVWLRRSCPGGE